MDTIHKKTKIDELIYHIKSDLYYCVVCGKIISKSPEYTVCDMCKKRKAIEIQEIIKRNQWLQKPSPKNIENNYNFTSISFFNVFKEM